MLGALDDACQQVPGAVDAVVLDDRVERVKPLAGLGRVDVSAVVEVPLMVSVI